MNLSLSKISLKNIEGMAFVGLINLMFLNLSNNYIKRINDLTFTNMKRLRVLDLSNNYIMFIFRSSFNQISLVYVDHINQCCYVKHICKLNNPIEYDKRCGSLLFSTSVEIMVFLYVGLILILNSGVLIFFIRVKRYNTHVLLLCCLSIIQIIALNYHITIITKHTMHADQFPLIMFQWTSHFVCKAIRFVSDFLETLSNSTLLILSINTMRLTKFSFEMRPYSQKNIMAFMFIGAIFSILVSYLNLSFWRCLSSFCVYKFNSKSYNLTNFMVIIPIIGLSISPQIAGCVITARIAIFLMSTGSVRSANSINTSSLKYRYFVSLIGHFINNHYTSLLSDGSVTHLIIYTLTTFLVTVIDAFMFTYSTKSFKIYVLKIME